MNARHFTCFTLLAAVVCLACPLQADFRRLPGGVKAKRLPPGGAGLNTL